MFCINLLNCSFSHFHRSEAMANSGGKCSSICDCAAGTCAMENGGKCGNCDCAAGRDSWNCWTCGNSIFVSFC